MSQADLAFDPPAGPAPVADLSARERILATAYTLFSQRGVRGVGIDEVIARSGVAKATLYRHFRSKDDLVLAFLQRREQQWTLDLVEKQSHLRGDTPEQRLLAIFDVFDDWFARREDFHGCSFVNVLLEMGADHPAGQAAIGYLDHIRGIVARRAEEADLRDPESFALSFHILMKGAIIIAAAGDPQAARRAKIMAGELIALHRTGAASTPPEQHIQSAP
jgi:AcrR family transcriptional regulator